MFTGFGTLVRSEGGCGRTATGHGSKVQGLKSKVQGLSPNDAGGKPRMDANQREWEGKSQSHAPIHRSGNEPSHREIHQKTGIIRVHSRSFAVELNCSGQGPRSKVEGALAQREFAPVNVSAGRLVRVFVSLLFGSTGRSWTRWDDRNNSRTSCPRSRLNRSDCGKVSRAFTPLRSEASAGQAGAATDIERPLCVETHSFQGERFGYGWGRRTRWP